MYSKIPAVKAPTDAAVDDLFSFGDRMQTLLTDVTKATSAGISNVSTLRPELDGLLANYQSVRDMRYQMLDEYNLAKQAVEPTKFSFETHEQEFLDLRAQIAIVIKKALTRSTCTAADALELEQRLVLLENEVGWEGGKYTFNIPGPVENLVLVKNGFRVELAWKIPLSYDWTIGASGTADHYDIEIDGQLAAVTPYTMKWLTPSGLAAGEHTVSVYAVNDAGRSTAVQATFTTV